MLTVLFVATVFLSSRRSYSSSSRCLPNCCCLCSAAHRQFGIHAWCSFRRCSCSAICTRINSGAFHCCAREPSRTAPLCFFRSRYFRSPFTTHCLLPRHRTPYSRFRASRAPALHSPSSSCRPPTPFYNSGFHAPRIRVPAIRTFSTLPVTPGVSSVSLHIHSQSSHCSHFRSNRDSGQPDIALSPFCSAPARCSQLSIPPLCATSPFMPASRPRSRPS